ncbi:MAG: glutaredoxin family protein [Nocardioidaceae bacterium]
MTVHVTLVGKPGCHLCDDARTVVERACAASGATWDEQSILDDPQLADEYAEQIPVVLVDGRRFDFWRIDEARLAARLTGS